MKTKNDYSEFKIGNNISIIDGVISVADTFSGDYNNLTNKPRCSEFFINFISVTTNNAKTSGEEIPKYK